MPFIFHQEKRSIFDRRIQVVTEDPINMSYSNDSTQALPVTRILSPSILKDHPFRKLNKPKEPFIVLFEGNQTNQGNNQVKNTTIKKNKIQKSKNRSNLKLQTSQNLQGSSKNNTQLQVVTQMKKDSHEDYFQQSQRIHEKKIKNYQPQQNSMTKKLGSNEERLKYYSNNNPGPGSYNIPRQSKEKSAVIFPCSPQKNPLLSTNDKILEQQINSKLKKKSKVNQKSFLLDCHYKNQSSPNFRSSILNKPTLKKNESLLNILFSNKKENFKQNQRETTCESQINSTLDNELYDQVFIKNEQRSPSPCSYDQKVDFPGTKLDKQSKVFISGVPKFHTNNARLPGPGQYEMMQKKGCDFDQNQNKKANKFSQDEKENSCVFLSKVPRQLNFGSGQRGKQQLYYSPKNNMRDIVQEKCDKSSLSSNFYFGSSLERFNQQSITNSDPYKYCFSKSRVNQNKKNCASIKFTAKRQMVNCVQNNVAPNLYENDKGTIEKENQKELYKILLKQRYQDQVLLLRQKKLNMQRTILDEKNKNIDIKTTPEPQYVLDPNKYKEYILREKRKEKESISFGSNKKSPLKRAIQGRKQVDLYYETDSGWQIKSFNKSYGLEVQID